MPPELKTEDILLTEWWCSVSIWYYHFNEKKISEDIYWNKYQEMFGA